MVVHLFLERIAVLFLVLAGSSYGQTSFVEKYITHNYFKKYSSLIDSQFNNFIANEIPLDLRIVCREGNCDMATLSCLHRSVIGEGSHRSLSSSVVLKLQHELKSDLAADSCKLVVIERLPTGVYADPFELQHLIERGVFTDAAVFGDTNLELPSFCSNPSVVEIHMSFAAKDDLEINFQIPLHARYQPLGHGYSRVEFGQPDWLLCCSSEANVHNLSCALLRSNQISDNQGSPVVWEIPCGIKEHAGVVSVVTFGAAIVAALLIILASVRQSDNRF